MAALLVTSVDHKLKTLKNKISFELARNAKLQIYLCYIISIFQALWNRYL